MNNTILLINKTTLMNNTILLINKTTSMGNTILLINKTKAQPTVSEIICIETPAYSGNVQTDVVSVFRTSEFE